MSEGTTIEMAPLLADQGYIRDYRTETWRNDLFQWHGIATLKWNGKSLTANVIAKSKIEDQSEGGKKLWGDLLRLAVAKAVERGSITAFDTNDLTYSIPDPLPNPMPTEVSATATATYIEKLDKEFDHDRAARESFKYAVERLRVLSGYGASSEAQQLFSFLQMSVRAANMGFNHSWYGEKMAGIARSLEDMARRKNKSHPGYARSRDYIQQQLYSFSPPDSWIDVPPVLDKRS